MKVAILCQHFDLVLPPDQNSLGIWTYEVARRLGGDCETTIIARRPRGGPARMEIDGVRFEFLRCAPARIWDKASRLWNQARPQSPLFANRFYAFDFLAQATQAIRRIEPDVVHIQNFPTHAPAIRRAAPQAAILLHMHCDWLAELDRKAMARGIAATDLVAGCSSHVASKARAELAELALPFVVLPNGTPVNDHAGAQPPRMPGKVLFVGRVSPEKGVHTLLEAWPRIVAACPEAHLEIVGPLAELPRELLIDLSKDADVLDLARFYAGGRSFRGTYAAALRAMIPYEIRNTVTFAGVQPYRELAGRYTSASLLVNPSLSESFGMSLVEALSAGTPVVATRVGGMPEIIKATGGGVLVEKNDATALAAQIVELLNQPERAAELGRRGAAKVAQLYSWERVAQQARSLYDQAIARRRQSEAAPGGLGERALDVASVARLHDVAASPVSSVWRKS